MKITDIAENKKNKNRVSIFIDGKFAAAVFKETALTHHLKIGQDMDEDQLIALIYEDEKQKCLEKAYQFLSFRERSVGEMRRKLQDKEFSPQIVEDVLYELQQQKLLNDVAFAREYAQQLLERGYGKRVIASKLYEKRIDREIIGQVVEELGSESEQAKKFGEKISSKYGKEEDPRKRQQKFVQAMARHGFGFDEAKAVYRELFENET